MENIINEILALGISKYQLAKRIGVSWNTINLWAKNFWKPDFENANRIIKFYKYIKSDQKERWTDPPRKRLK